MLYQEEEETAHLPKVGEEEEEEDSFMQAAAGSAILFPCAFFSRYYSTRLNSQIRERKLRSSLMQSRRLRAPDASNQIGKDGCLLLQLVACCGFQWILRDADTGWAVSGQIDDFFDAINS